MGDQYNTYRHPDGSYWATGSHAGAFPSQVVGQGPYQRTFGADDRPEDSRFPQASENTLETSHFTQTADPAQSFSQFVPSAPFAQNMPPPSLQSRHGSAGPPFKNALLPSSEQAQLIAELDFGLVPQWGEITRNAFTRTLPDGREEYIQAVPHERGNTIPDALSKREGGRTYQVYREDKYYMPNDAAEQDRLDLNHVPFTLLLGGALYKAPIRNPRRVLDIGTGTGIWAIDFAERHPKATVIGVDLSLIQPPVRARLPNIEFVREDVEDDWIWDEPFDFMHQRLMFTCINDHRALAKKMFDNLKPGGWVEYQDSGIAIQCDDGSAWGTALHQWGYLVMAAAAAKGRDVEVTRRYKEFLRDVGFVDVHEEVIKAPGNTWPDDPMQKRIGMFSATSVLEGIQGLARLLQQGLKWPVHDVENLVRRAQKDVVNPEVRWWYPFVVVYGRKPYPGEFVPKVE